MYMFDTENLLNIKKSVNILPMHLEGYHTIALEQKSRGESRDYIQMTVTTEDLRALKENIEYYLQLFDEGEEINWYTKGVVYMGLGLSHGNFHASYSGFNQMRAKIVKDMFGIEDLNTMLGFGEHTNMTYHAGTTP